MSAECQFEVFQYPAETCAPELAWDEGEGEVGSEAPARPITSASEINAEAAEKRLRGEWEKRLAEETRRAFEAGRERGRQEGIEAARQAHAAAESERRENELRRAADLLSSFTAERDRFLDRVEQEVVKLALAVAARILRREAQMDPLLLTGAVRVALGQLGATAEVRLRVPAEDLDLWAEAVKLLPNLAIQPTLVAGEGMRLGECEIESAIGSVDLGIRAQLGEIERGFFDRAPASGELKRSVGEEPS